MAIDIYNSGDNSEEGINYAAVDDPLEHEIEHEHGVTIDPDEQTGSKEPHQDFITETQTEAPHQVPDETESDSIDPPKKVRPFYSKSDPDLGLDNTRFRFYQSSNAIMVRLLMLSAIFLLVWILKGVSVSSIVNLLNLGTSDAAGLGVSLSVIVFLGYVILSGILILSWRRTWYEVNDEQIIIKDGSKLSRERYEGTSKRIILITVEHGIIAKWLNYGKVHLNGIEGLGGQDVYFNNVDDPYGVKEMIEKIVGLKDEEEIEQSISS